MVHPPEQQGGLVGLAGRVASQLPPQFLMLVLLNIIFLGVVFWHQQKQDEARERLFTPILMACFRDLHQTLQQLSPVPAP
jgi:hypothetical protein